MSIPIFSDMESESVEMPRSGSMTVQDLPAAVPSDAARYHVFRFKHNHEGDYLESNGNIRAIYYDRTITPLLQCSSTPCPATPSPSRRG